MSTIESLYNIVQIPAESYDSNKIYFPIDNPVTINFSLSAEGFDAKDIYSVYWHFGDPYAENDNTNQIIKYDLSDVSHIYSQNGMYDLNCIISTSTYTVHLTKKVSIITTGVPFYINPIQTNDGSYIATLNNYDPQAITYYISPTDLNWNQYSTSVTGDANDAYIAFYTVFSDGEESVHYAQPISDNIKIELLNVYDASASATIHTDTDDQYDTIYTAYTTAGSIPYSSIIVSATSADEYYHLNQSVKIRFINDKPDGSTDLLNPDVSGSYILYRLLSGGGTRMFRYTKHFNIKNNDILFWQIVYETSAGTAYSSIRSTQFIIDTGISSDIVGYSQQVYPISY